MNFRENAISLAYKLRSPEDQVNYLQKNRIFITSFNCLVCDIVCERVNWAAAKFKNWDFKASKWVAPDYGTLCPKV